MPRTGCLPYHNWRLGRWPGKECPLWQLHSQHYLHEESIVRWMDWLIEYSNRVARARCLAVCDLAIMTCSTILHLIAFECIWGPRFCFWTSCGFRRSVWRNSMLGHQTDRNFGPLDIKLPLTTWYYPMSIGFNKRLYKSVLARTNRLRQATSCVVSLGHLKARLCPFSPATQRRVRLWRDIKKNMRCPMPLQRNHDLTSEVVQPFRAYPAETVTSS